MTGRGTDMRPREKRHILACNSGRIVEIGKRWEGKKLNFHKNPASVEHTCLTFEGKNVT
jgi:hypothetical protein